MLKKNRGACFVNAFIWAFSVDWLISDYILGRPNIWASEVRFILVFSNLACGIGLIWASGFGWDKDNSFDI